MGKLKKVLIEAEEKGVNPDTLLLKEAVESEAYTLDKLRLVKETLEHYNIQCTIDDILVAGYEALKDESPEASTDDIKDFLTDLIQYCNRTVEMLKTALNQL